MITIEQIDAALPQTQCEQCGYKGCLKYAEAILSGEDINRCPPGGDEGIKKLSLLLGRPFQTLNSDCGVHVPYETAEIDYDLCIGCRLCAKVCPTEAVIGTRRHEHCVDEALCTGCCLCQIACPMDCISMKSTETIWTVDLATQSRQLFHEKKRRAVRLAEEKEAELSAKSSPDKKKALLKSLMTGKGP